MPDYIKFATNKECNCMLSRESNCLSQAYSSLGRMMYLARVKEEL